MSPNAAEFSQSLTRMLKARVPFISIRTSERGRALDLIRPVASAIGKPILVHTLSRGLRDIETQRSVSDERSVVGALDYVGQQMSARNFVTVVMTDISEIDADNATTRQIYDTVVLASENAGSVVVLVASPVWVPLQRLGMNLTLDPPDENEVYEILTKQIDQYRGQMPIDWHEEAYRRAAQILCGITKIEVENIAATLVASGRVALADLDELSRIKDRMFSDINGIERVRVEPDEIALGGLDGLRTWLEQERDLFMSDLRSRHLRPPRGLILVGVPGCGKSISAKRIAADWRLPLYRLDLATIHGQYLGQSEARLKEALAAADQVAPCVLWIDEIEKGLAGAASGSDGGTSSRVVGQFLFWLQEGRAKVFVVATANDVSRLPPELLRRGRFDELFFVDLPTADERRDIIQIYCRRNLRGSINPALLSELVELTEGFAGADLEAAVREVAKEAIRYGDESLSTDVFLRRFGNIIPLSKTSPDQIEQIRAWGRERALPASGRPIDAPVPGRPAGRSVIVR